MEHAVVAKRLAERRALWERVAAARGFQDGDPPHPPRLTEAQALDAMGSRPLAF